MEDIKERLGRVAIIGGGKMGEAILSGLVNGVLFDTDTVFVAEPDADRRAYLSSVYQVDCFASGAEISHPTTAILAVKPQVLHAICTELASSPGFAPKRIVSIAAGITTATLRELFSEGAVIRVMPNAPLMVGAGMSAVCVASDTPRSEGEIVRELFAMMGEAILVPESQLNAVTAISGSGPAYFALFVEELAKAGEGIGLAPEDALLLSIQTLQGTARYLELTEASPAELRMAVTSPQGTTAAALDEFRVQGLTDVVKAAVLAALNRAEELA